MYDRCSDKQTEEVLISLESVLHPRQMSWQSMLQSPSTYHSRSLLYLQVDAQKPSAVDSTTKVRNF